MAININVNGESINYPQTGDTNWSDEATDFAVQTASAFGKIGLSSGTTVDISGTLDVTGNTTLDANLSVTGNTTITGNLTANGNSNLGNASGDTIAVTGILNVDSGVLYVDPTNNRVGINKTNPSQALDVTGNVAITGNETVGGTLGVTGDVAVNTNKFNVTATSGNTTIAGTLGVTGDVAINTNKFNVTASSGNTTIAGTLGISNGTASAPSLTPSGDTNTGLYSIGADTIGFSSNGVRVGEFGNGYGGFTGNIIQVVSTAKTDTSTLSTTFGTISGLSQSITPKYSTSKILIIINISFGRSADNIIYFKILRGSTDIYIGDVAGSRTRASAVNYMSNIATGTQVNNITLVFLDSPATNTLITYNTQGRTDSGSCFINRSGTDTDTAQYFRMASSITVMELQQ